MSFQIQAQTYLELLVSMGTSNITPASIDRINEEVPPNEIQWHSGFSRGLEARLSVPILKKLSLKPYFSYNILQNNFSQVEERTSYSWIYREVKARLDEHSLSGGFMFQYDIFQENTHSFSTFLKFGVSMVHYNDAYTSEKRINFYPPEEEFYEGRISESPDWENAYYNLGAGISYNYSFSKKFSIVVETAYLYFYNESSYYERENITPIDWNNLYGSLGVRYDLSSNKD